MKHVLKHFDMIPERIVFEELLLPLFLFRDFYFEVQFETFLIGSESTLKAFFFALFSIFCRSQIAEFDQLFSLR